MDGEKNILAIRINQMRKELDLTQEELALKLGLKGKSSIANYESGKITPSDEIKLKMCRLFNCSMDYLMGLTSYKNPKEDLEKELSQLNLTESEFNEIVSLLLDADNDNIDIVLRSSTKLSEASSKCLDLIYDYFNNSNKDSSKNINKLSDIIKSLDKNKILNKYQKRNSNQVINFLKKRLFNIPVLGKIAAGQPLLVEEYLEGYLPVDPNIYGMTTPDDYFYLKVSGESMNLKIHNGDYALIHKQDYADDGDIIVAIVNGDDEATLKRYKHINESTIALEPMSTFPMEPIYINLKDTNFKIIGKAIGKFGKF